MKPHAAPTGASRGKRVLLTGGSGFIGRQAIPFLREKGYDVHAVSAHAQAEIHDVTWHQTDLLDEASRKALLEKVKPSHILHFAWIATPGIYWTSPLNENWKEATLDLLQLAKVSGVERFVSAGSCAEYDWSSGHCDEKTTPLMPATPYGKAKAETSQIVTQMSDLSTAWGRIFFLYGPHEDTRRLVPSVILSLLKGERAKCTHGKQVRDFLHVADVASAFVSLLESNVTGPVNVASGAPVTIREVVETIASELDAPDSVEFGAIDPPTNDPPRLKASVERLSKEVGWQPSFSLEEGLRNTIEWWKEQL